jgi:hypothetical protein
MCPKALQLRMVPIASCLPSQHRPCQECFAPQRNQTLRIEVPRMNGPESHVIQWRPNFEIERWFAARLNEGSLSEPSTFFHPTTVRNKT